MTYDSALASASASASSVLTCSRSRGQSPEQATCETPDRMYATYVCMYRMYVLGPASSPGASQVELFPAAAGTYDSTQLARSDAKIDMRLGLATRRCSHASQRVACCCAWHSRCRLVEALCLEGGGETRWVCKMKRHAAKEEGLANERTRSAERQGGSVAISGPSGDRKLPSKGLGGT